MKKLLAVLGVGVMSVGILAACGSTEELSIKEDGAAEEIAPKEKQKEVTPEIGTRTNPVKVGETLSVTGVTVTDLDDWEKQTVGDFNLTLNKVTRGEEAYTMIMSYNQFNEPAPDGFEYVLLDFTLTGSIEDPNIAEYVSPSLTVIASDGSEVEQDSAVLENEFGSKEMFDGGTVTGHLEVIVPIGDDVVVEYEDDFSAFFSLN
jgi:hypothetical protein